jgi:hypothetical protein
MKTLKIATAIADLIVSNAKDSLGSHIDKCHKKENLQQ